MRINQAILNELVDGLKQIFKEELVSVILYGSVARETDTDDSDVDVAIILKNKKEGDTLNQLLDLTVDMDLKYDKVFSVVDINYDEFMTWQEILPFYRNVKKDGVVLWKAA